MMWINPEKNQVFLIAEAIACKDLTVLYKSFREMIIVKRKYVQISKRVQSISKTIDWPWKTLVTSADTREP